MYCSCGHADTVHVGTGAPPGSRLASEPSCCAMCACSGFERSDLEERLQAFLAEERRQLVRYAQFVRLNHELYGGAAVELHNDYMEWGLSGGAIERVEEANMVGLSPDKISVE